MGMQIGPTVQTCATDNFEKEVLDDISKYGWHCVSILPENDLAPYSFTVGLYHSHAHPELIILGLKSEVAHRVLCNAVAGLPAERLDLSLPTDELLNGYPCCFVEVSKTHYYENVGFARWYYNGNEFPLYQIVWPSRDGHFPWHPKATQEFKLAQPVLTDAPVDG
jgi:hypothetical protein